MSIAATLKAAMVPPTDTRATGRRYPLSSRRVRCSHGRRIDIVFGFALHIVLPLVAVDNPLALPLWICAYLFEIYTYPQQSKALEDFFNFFSVKNPPSAALMWLLKQPLQCPFSFGAGPLLCEAVPAPNKNGRSNVAGPTGRAALHLGEKARAKPGAGLSLKILACAQIFPLPQRFKKSAFRASRGKNGAAFFRRACARLPPCTVANQ